MESATGSVQSDKMKLKLAITVVSNDFDPVAGVIRVKGTNMTESPHIRVNCRGGVSAGEYLPNLFFFDFDFFPKKKYFFSLGRFTRWR